MISMDNMGTGEANFICNLHSGINWFHWIARIISEVSNMRRASAYHIKIRLRYWLGRLGRWSTSLSKLD